MKQQSWTPSETFLYIHGPISMWAINWYKKRSFCYGRLNIAMLQSLVPQISSKRSVKKMPNRDIVKILADQKNRTIFERARARSLLSTWKLSWSLWVNACESTEYLLNYTGISLEEKKSSHESWTVQQTSKLHHLRVFGIKCYALLLKNFRHKFNTKSVLGHLVCYINKKDGYKIDLPSQNKIIRFRYV